MPAFNITRFYGMIPRTGDDLLPEGEQVNVATLAINSRVKSGHLVPYRETTTVAQLPYELDTFIRVPVDNSIVPEVWFSWENDADLVMGTVSDTEFVYNGDFFYYTEEGTYPRMTYGDYALGNQSANEGLRYPRNTSQHGNFQMPSQFALGIPKPSTRPGAEVIPYEPKATAGYERDSSNRVTITTQQPHGLRNGNVITVSGFGDRTTNDPIVVPPITDPGDDTDPSIDPQ